MKKGTSKIKRCWVIKIGSSLLTSNGHGIDTLAIRDWVEQICSLRKNDIDIVLVTSGAIAEGIYEVGLKIKPNRLDELQAIASIGQMKLVQIYKDEFIQKGVLTGQVLLTHGDLINEEKKLNAKRTIKKLMEWGVVPIINENDTVSSNEICFGDNDYLAAMTVDLIKAERLIILTDQYGIYDKNPSIHDKATIIKKAYVQDPFLDQASEGSGALGTGGMITKINAARLAAKSHVSTSIAYGKEKDVLIRIQRGQAVGTILLPTRTETRT